MGSVPRLCFRSSKLDTSPCYGCDERVVGCHSSCERYKEYHEKNVADHQTRKEAYMAEYDVQEYLIDSKMKTLKNCRRRW